MGVLAPVAEEAWVDRAAGEVRRRDAQSGVVIGASGLGVSTCNPYPTPVMPKMTTSL
jgi:hypothetical protein